MDIYKAIRDLLEEKKRLDAVIASLEVRGVRPAANNKKRGRKSMTAEERAAVSRRMAAYWAARRSRGLEQAEESPASESAANEGTQPEQPPQDFQQSMAAAAPASNSALTF